MAAVPPAMATAAAVPAAVKARMELSGELGGGAGGRVGCCWSDGCCGRCRRLACRRRLRVCTNRTAAQIVGLE